MGKMKDIVTEATESNWQRNIYTTAVEVFQIPIHLRSQFERHYLLHWTPQYLISVFNNGTIVRDGIDYHVVNHTLADITQWIHDPYIRVSFRKLPDLKYGFVLVRRMRPGTKPVQIANQLELDV